jgi:hypothetical protein
MRLRLARLTINGRDTFQQLENTVKALRHSVAAQEMLEDRSDGIFNSKFNAARERAAQANKSAQEAIHRCSGEIECAVALH